MYISRDVFMSLREETSICVYARTPSPYDHFGPRDIHHGRSVGFIFFARLWVTNAPWVWPS